MEIPLRIPSLACRFTDLTGLVAPERIFGDIRGMIPDPLKLKARATKTRST